MIPFTYSGNTLVAVLLGKTCYIESGTPRFVSVIEAIRDDKSEQEILDIIETSMKMSDYIETQNNPRITVVGDEVFMDGKVLHSAITDRIIEFKENCLPIEHLVKFLERIYANPSYNSREQLFKFLEHKDLVITEDGYFLAYKGIKSNYKDVYTGTIDNSPGRTIKMDRHLIDDNPASHCSKGLHVGAISYATNWSQGRVVIVKVDPMNVVSVPNDHNCQKCRVCEYTVIRDSDGLMKQPLYTNTGEPYQPSSYDGDWDFADDDIDDVYDDGEVYSYSDDTCSVCDYEYNDCDCFDEDDEDEDTGPVYPIKIDL